MNEASVSSDFMSRLRKRLPGAVVVKHRDASMIGLPDCSVTFNGRTWWIEFKLFRPGARWDGRLNVPAIANASPTQREMMNRLLNASGGRALYLVWVKKGARVVGWFPQDNAYQFETETTGGMVEAIALMLERSCPN
jgi:hypothetical protein